MWTQNEHQCSSSLCPFTLQVPRGPDTKVYRNPRQHKSQRIFSQKNPQFQALPIEIEDEKRIGGGMLNSVHTGSDYHLTSTEIRSTIYLV